MAGSENEHANSSSGEEEEEVSSEGSESDSEPDKTPTPPPPPPPSSDQLPDPSIIKPLASKPMDSDQSKKPRSKNPTSPPPPLKQSTGKRPAAEEDEDEDEGTDFNKRNKKEANNGGEKKQLFQRLWSEDNEVELIQGMIDYVEAKGKDPAADVNDFHEFVKQSLHVDVNDRQMLAKARRLKKKFENNAARVENKGKVRSFSNPHEKKMYDLSKNLWGNDSNRNVVMSSSTKKVKVKVNVTPKTNKTHKTLGAADNGNDVEPKVEQPKVVLSVSRGSDHLGSLGLPITDEAIMNKGLELVLGSKKVEMEEKWKNLKMQELAHFMKKVDVLKEQAEIVFNAIAKSVAK